MVEFLTRLFDALFGPHKTERPPTVCAWCDRTMREGHRREPYHSHGICDDCEAEWFATWTERNR